MKLLTLLCLGKLSEALRHIPLRGGTYNCAFQHKGI